MKKIIFSAAMLTAALATAQNTGIGTTAPKAKLDVIGGIRVLKGLPTTTADGSNIGYAFDQDGDTGIFADGTNSASSSNIIIYSDNQPRLFIGGNLKNGIGIGTVNPAASLDVVGNFKLTDGTQGVGKVLTSDASGLAKWLTQTANNIYTSDGQLTGTRTVNQNSQLLSFTNGNVALGNSLFANGQLELSNIDTGDRTPFIDFHSSNGVDYSTRIYRGAGTNGDFVITNTGTGRILLGNRTYVNGNLGAGGMDFVLGDGSQTDRGNSGLSRALVKNGNATDGSQLYINYGNDFTAGARVDSKFYITNTGGAADAVNDKILTIGAQGEVKNSGSTLAQVASASEPWYVANTTNPATANNQNIYQIGNVGIGTNTPTSQLHVVSPSNISAQLSSSTTESVLRIMPSNSLDNRLAIITNSDRLDTTIRGFANNVATDFLIMKHATGNIGISVADPTQKLDVAGNARVRQMPATSDEATYSRVVVADTSGNLATVSRTDPGVPNATETIFQNLQVGTDIIPNDTFYTIQQNMSTLGSAYWRYSGKSITLPPGKWIVYCSYLVAPTSVGSNPARLLETGTSVWFRGMICADNTDGQGNSAVIAGSPSLVSCSLTANSEYQGASGVWLVDNNTGADKTYYVKVSIQPYGFSAANDKDLSKLSIWAEDYLFAIKRK